MSTEAFLSLGNLYTKTKSKSSYNTKLRRFKSLFGVSPSVCAVIWIKLIQEMPSASLPKHLLWALCFLKQYSTEHLRSALFKADEKTVRYWTWTFIQMLADLDVINWNNRFDLSAPGQTCFCSLDGVDFKIFEPKPFNRRYFSHKFRGAGLRYEIGVCIRSGYIVWKHGGYPCGEYPDIKIARGAYVESIATGEMTMADKGYRDSRYFILPTPQNSSTHKYIMARHETVNKRIKQFRILQETFRHELNKHPIVFHAVCNLTQLMIQNGEPLFSVM